MVNEISYKLYLKTHLDTGLKYLGMTTGDPFSYRGSGVYWIRHLKTHGYNIKTEVLGEYNNHDDLSRSGKYYSELWDIVESESFANLVPELGENSSGMKGKKQNEETKKKIANSLKGRQRPEEVKEKLRLSNKGQIPWNKGLTGLYSHTEEHKAALSEKMKINNPMHYVVFSDEFKQRQRDNQKKK